MTYEKLKILFEDHFKISRPADIARTLGVSPQAVSNWKSRNQVPYKYAMILKEKLDESVKNYQDTTISNFNNKAIQTQKSSNYNFEHSNMYGNDIISINEIIRIVKKHKKLILTIPTIFCSITIFYLLFFAEPVYVSNATIIPAYSESSISKMAGIASQFGINLPGNSADVKKFVYPEIIKSRTLMKKMLSKTFDTNKYGPNQTLLRLLTFKDDEPEYGIDTLEIIGVETLLENINVDEDIETGLIKLSVGSFEPKLSADMAIALINELDIHQKGFNLRQAAKKRIFIEERIREVKLDLEKSEERLKAWRQRNRNIGDSPALLLEQERLMREAEVQKQLFITLKQEFEVAQIEEVEDSDILHVLDHPEVPIRRTKPNRKLLVLMAGFLGTGFGFFGALIKDYVDENKLEF